MRIKPTTKTGGVLLELGPEEAQIPAQSLETARAFKLQKILVPVDFSDCSKKALHYAIPFARQFGAELKLLHVLAPYPAVPEMAPYDFDDIHDCREELNRLQKEIEGEVRSTTGLRKGLPHMEIAAAAREFGADLIIISTHGRKGFSRMLLGSTTEKVVRHAPCPVLIVRECEHEFVPSGK
ncbi:MAG: universal stress protein [Verrucomicrobia bacterium]|nr:MAG: universal stress protein [Verrucomicrobiota bacterium]